MAAALLRLRRTVSSEMRVRFSEIADGQPAQRFDVTAAAEVLAQVGARERMYVPLPQCTTISRRG